MPAKSYKVSNTRRFRRLMADYPVKYQVSGSKDEPYVANIKDISAGGVKFWSERLFEERTLLKISFVVPPLARTVEALGRVLRIHKAKNSKTYYIAAALIEMSSADQEAINEFAKNFSKISKSGFVLRETGIYRRRGGS